MSQRVSVKANYISKLGVKCFSYLELYPSYINATTSFENRFKILEAKAIGKLKVVEKLKGYMLVDVIPDIEKHEPNCELMNLPADWDTCVFNECMCDYYLCIRSNNNVNVHLNGEVCEDGEM